MSRRYVPPHLRRSQPTTRSTPIASNKSRQIARRRLAHDLAELERERISSIAAYPIDNNIFEWHVNIKPTDGVYSEVYFHLIMSFPDTYPSNPPTIKICTPISHPNIFNSFLCLSMLRSYTGNIPYEGWSGAYSVTSILMQLQSFLFAEKIDQDGGYQVNAQLSHNDVKSSIAICKTFKCDKCSHSHSTPWPEIKGLTESESIIKVCPIDVMQSEYVTVQGSSALTTHTHWVGVKSDYGCKNGKILYEANISGIGGGLCRFGYGSKSASICGGDIESFGYGGNGKYSYNNNHDDFGRCFTENDTITVAVDFGTMRIYFGKNGRIMKPKRKIYIPENLRGKELFPLLAFKNAKVECNFSSPRKPCKVLKNKGFKSLEQIKKEKKYAVKKKNNEDGDDMKSEDNVDWHSQYVIDELWVDIFEGLLFQDIFSVQFVCKKWYKLINNYNLIERSNEISCYFSKEKLGDGRFGKILGIGLSIRSSNIGGLGIAIHSQMDILSLDAWNNGCRTGVWGEELSHFLPLVMNKKHSELADESIKYHLQSLTKLFCTVRRSNANELERCINRTNCLKLVDSLITMMNLMVVQFVMGYKNDNHTVSMVMCEKVVLGYCALHHLLLYLVSQNKQTITDFANKTVSLFINNGSDKKITKDLGKFLIYLMISTDYNWNDVAQQFVEESFTRNVMWMLQEIQYTKYDTTNIVHGRLENSFIASKISHRLIMFQVWFMKNNASETLKGYNQRLGRPTIKVRNSIFNKTKFILNIKSWWDYFNELGIIIQDDEAIDELLRFAIYNSDLKGYHRHCNTSGPIYPINAPKIRYKMDKVKRAKKEELQICPNNIETTMIESTPITINEGNNNNIQSTKQGMSKAQRRKLRRKNANKGNIDNVIINQQKQERMNNDSDETWISDIRPQSISRQNYVNNQRRPHRMTQDIWISEIRPQCISREKGMSKSKKRKLRGKNRDKRNNNNNGN